MDVVANDQANAMTTTDDSVQPTQLQETQEASQVAPSSDDHLWAYMTPCSSVLRRIDFMKPEAVYKIGRNTEGNQVIFPGFKISNQHATIRWDGLETDQSSITIIDNSSNGTFINGVKIGRGNHRILRDGQEIAFGSVSAQKPDEDYRFIFRHNAGGRPTTGLLAFYEVAHELGRGSFATVMKAMSRKTGMWYAVKMIRERHTRENSTASDERREKMITREIEIMRRLKHPNICELKDVFLNADGSMSLVLELVEGGDLLEYILSRNGLNEAISQHLTYQLCLALSYIHHTGIAHRDLKPENVLLTNENPPNVKVADFGLAKAADSVTMLKTMCGTPSYLAPEVVRQENMEGYDNLVDSWSVGVIVFSMLANASPFIEDETQPDIRVRIAERTVDWALLEHGRVSQLAKDFIRCLLTEDPRARMTLTGALDHPWLIEYTDRAGIDKVASRAQGVHADLSTIPSTSSMTSSGGDIILRSEESGSMSHGFGNLHINSEAGPSSNGQATTSAGDASGAPAAVGSSIPGLGFHNQQPETADGSQPSNSNTPPPSSSQANNAQRASSRVLRRRSNVLAQAAEGDPNTVIPEPTPEMIGHFARIEQDRYNKAAGNAEAGPSSWGEKQAGKRLHHELSTLSEEGSLNDVPMANGGGSNGGAIDNDVEPKAAKPQPTPAKKARKGKESTVPNPNTNTDGLRRSSRAAAKKH